MVKNPRGGSQAFCASVHRRKRELESEIRHEMYENLAGERENQTGERENLTGERIDYVTSLYKCKEIQLGCRLLLITIATVTPDSQLDS